MEWFDANLMVSSLIDPETKRWNILSLSEVFVQGDVEIILRNQPVVEKSEYFTWNFNKVSTYSEICVLACIYLKS